MIAVGLDWSLLDRSRCVAEFIDRSLRVFSAMELFRRVSRWRVLLGYLPPSDESSMSDSHHVKQCPDCKGELEAIKLFGRGWKNPVSGAAIDAEMIYYTDASAERSSFRSMFDAAGTVQATMCRECQRIFLHGVPN